MCKLRWELKKKIIINSIYGQFRQFLHISEPRLSKLFFFQTWNLGSIVSRDIWKLRHKLKNAKNLPALTWSWPNKSWFTIWKFCPSAGQFVQSAVGLSKLPWAEIAFCPTKYVLSERHSSPAKLVQIPVCPRHSRHTNST